MYFSWYKDGAPYSENREGNCTVDYAKYLKICTSTIKGESRAGNYFVKAANNYGESESNMATVSYTFAPILTLDPISQTVNENQTITFSVNASGDPAPTFQWKKNGIALPDALNLANFTIQKAVKSSIGEYSVLVQNRIGSITSKTAHIAVNLIPAITLQPLAKTVTETQSISLKSKAEGTSPLTYQWLKNGKPISGAIQDTYMIPRAQRWDKGSYALKVKNTAGEIVSSQALIDVISINGDKIIATREDDYNNSITTQTTTNFVRATISERPTQTTAQDQPEEADQAGCDFPFSDSDSTAEQLCSILNTAPIEGDCSIKGFISARSDIKVALRQPCGPFKKLGYTPLHYAATHKKFELISLFSQSDPSNIDLQDTNGYSVAMMAAQSGDSQTLYTALSLNPDWELTTKGNDDGSDKLGLMDIITSSPNSVDTYLEYKVKSFPVAPPLYECLDLIDLAFTKGLINRWAGLRNCVNASGFNNINNPILKLLVNDTVYENILNQKLFSFSKLNSLFQNSQFNQKTASTYIFNSVSAGNVNSIQYIIGRRPSAINEMDRNLKTALLAYADELIQTKKSIRKDMSTQGSQVNPEIQNRQSVYNYLQQIIPLESTDKQ